MFVFCAALCGLEAEAAPAVLETNGMKFSFKIRYPPLAIPGREGITSPEVIPTVNSKLQLITGNNITGDTSNPEMSDPITLPRCGFNDTIASKTGGRTRRWTHEGSKWPKTNLTYMITKYTNQLDKADVDQTIAEAFAMWSDHTDFTFSPESGEVDIKISFEREEHGDSDCFDSNYLAHAFFPKYGGDIHFNDDYKWTTSVTSNGDYNLLATAIHEIGHSLGLGHSENKLSAMWRNVAGFEETLSLTSDDIEGIQELYGPKTTVENVRGICTNGLAGTIFFSAAGHHYVFKGLNYWMITDDGLAAGYPKPIATTWIGLPGNIDLAFTNELGETYFFKDSKYWKFIGQKMDADSPREDTELDDWYLNFEAQERMRTFLKRNNCSLNSIRSIFRSTRRN